VPTAQNDIIIIVYLLIYDGGVVRIHRTPQLPVLYYRLHLLNNSNNIAMIIIIIIYCKSVMTDDIRDRSTPTDHRRSVGCPKCCCCGGGGSRFHFSAGLYPFHTIRIFFFLSSAHFLRAFASSPPLHFTLYPFIIM